MKKILILFITVIAIALSGCSKEKTRPKSSAATREEDVSVGEIKDGYYYGIGYKFKMPQDWIYVSCDEKTDLSMVYNSMNSNDKYGVINMKISSIRLGEEGYYSDDTGLQYYYIDDYVYTTINSIWGLSIEQIQGLEIAG